MSASTLPTQRLIKLQDYDLKDAISKNRLLGLWRLMKGYRVYYFGAIFSQGLSALSKTMTLLLLSYFVDKVLIRDDMLSVVPFVALGFVLLALFEGGFRFLSGRWAAQTAEGVAIRLRNYLFDHLQRLSFRYHDKNPTGDLLQRCTSDVDAVRRFFVDQGAEIGRIILLFLVNFVAIATMHWQLALISSLVIPAVIGVSLVFFKRVSDRYEKYQEQEAIMSTRLQENLSGVRVVKAFARQEYEIDRFETENFEHFRRGQKMLMMHALFWPTLDIMTGIQLLAGYLIAGLLVMENTLTIGEYLAYAGMVIYIIFPMRNLGRVIVQMSTGMVSYDRVMEVVREDREPLREGEAAPVDELKGDVVFDDVWFEYETNTPVLKGISFAAKPGQVIALMGSTGSGKTSLVGLLTRFYEVTKGRILLDGINLSEYPRDFLRRSIGIVEQEPFLFSRTIRENITYGVGRAVSDEEVFRAAKAAAIHHVIEGFPNGYNTLVGERGVTLSGGQKQRVTVARTLLKNPRILIMDDATSSVDTETEAAIRTALKELLPGRTSFIIAHRIQTVMSADLIVVFDKGQIVQMGTHSQLLRDEEGIYRRIYDMQSRIDEELEGNSRVSDDYQFEEEEFSTSFNGGTVLRILAQLKPHWRWVVGFLISIGIVSGLESYFTYLSKLIIDDGIIAGNREALYSTLIQYGLMMVLQIVFVFLFIYMCGILGHRVQYDLRRKLFNHLQTLSFSYYDRTPVGWIMSRLTSDPNRIADLVTWGILDITWAVMNISTALIFMATIHWQLSLIVAVMIPVLIVIAIWFKQQILVEYREVRKFNSKITGTYNENITGVRVVKALRRENENLREFGELTGQMHSHAYRAAWWSALFMPMVQITSAFAVGAVVLFGGVQVPTGGLTIGGLQAFIGYITFMMWPIMDMARVYSEMQHAIASAERVFSLMDAKPDIHDREGATDPGTIRGDLVFENVDFYYDPAKPVLTNFSLRVKQGETIALVGPTGGGKSTIVNLVCRFYEPKAGRITINGQDYTTMPMHAIHSRIGMVLQTPHLFSGKIRENIRYGRLDATDDEVIEAAKLAGADAFIINLEKGYDEEVGEGGILLSVGQKQLISLARAILANPEIFIMDEATSSVDTLTEALIQQGMEAVMKDRTSFVIAHRLSTIRRADRIVVISGGEIEEMGSHSELLRKKGHYYNLYTQQFREELEREYDEVFKIARKEESVEPEHEAETMTA